MGRLIDAGKFLNNLSGMLKSMEDYDAVRKVINNMPTAYDVDKVVNILQQQAEQYHSRAEKYAVAGVNSEVEHMAGKAASYEYAIEIVKAGGIE